MSREDRNRLIDISVVHSQHPHTQEENRKWTINTMCCDCMQKGLESRALTVERFMPGQFVFGRRGLT